jgi:hypothetical protein
VAEALPTALNRLVIKISLGLNWTLMRGSISQVRISLRKRRIRPGSLNQPSGEKRGMSMTFVLQILAEVLLSQLAAAIVAMVLA